MALSKEQTKKIEEKLLAQKERLEKDLRSFAQKDPNIKGDWTTRFQRFEEGSNLEEAADEVEQYATNLPIEHSLELRLQAISRALEKIKKGTYGMCESCKNPIDMKRIEIYPEAKHCLDCEKHRKPRAKKKP